MARGEKKKRETYSGLDQKWGQLDVFVNYPEKQTNIDSFFFPLQLFKLQVEEAQNTAATNDPEITASHRKQFELAKSLQTNTASANEYTLPSPGFSICQVQPRLVEVLIGAVAKHVWRNVYI